MNRRKQLFESPAKIIYEGTEPETVVQYFRDMDASGNTGDGRGVLNNRISEYFHQRLDDVGLPTSFVRRLNMREQLVRQVEMLPIAIMVRNMVDGNLAARLNLPVKTRLHRPVVELFLNDWQQADPIVTEEHIANFGWIAPQDLDEMLAIATRTHDLVSGMLMAAGYNLVDLRMEFGRLYENHAPHPSHGDEIREEIRVVLCSDLSPDTMRLFDRQTSSVVQTTGFEPWRHHVFGPDAGKPGVYPPNAHATVAERLGIMPNAGAVDLQGPSTLQ